MKNSYFLIILARGIEIAGRFIFLFIVVKNLSLADFGSLSFVISVFQGSASILFTSCLQIFTFLNVSERVGMLKTLILVLILLTTVLFLSLGSQASIFAFYGSVYIATGWFISQSRQVFFSFVRSVSFWPPTLLTFFWGSEALLNSIYMGFWVGTALVLSSCLPAGFLRAPLSFNEKRLFAGLQAHNVFFQFNKILERQIFRFILDEKAFGLYSLLRDLTNGFNLAFFSSFYQLTFRKIVGRAPSETFKKYRRKIWVFVFVILTFVLLSELSDQILRRITASFLNKDLPVRFFFFLALIVLFDLGKAFFLMLLEALRKIPLLLRFDLFELLIVVSLMVGSFIGSGLVRPIESIGILMIYRLVVPIFFIYKLLSQHENTLS